MMKPITRLEAEQHTILLSLSGSRLYGTYMESSDYDYKGIFIAPPEHKLGLQTVEQCDGKAFFDAGAAKLFEILDGTDTVLYELKRFFQLAIKANPNVIEPLFAPRCAIKECTSVGYSLLANRQMFVSDKLVSALLGYADGQLYRLRQHKAWLDKGEIEKPVLTDFLPDGCPSILGKQELNALYQLIWLQFKDKAELLDEESKAFLLERIQVKNSFNSQGLSDLLLATCSGKAKAAVQLLQGSQSYASTMKQYKSYCHWKNNRNPERAALEAKCGYDSKHAMHLIRLLQMAYKAKTTGKIDVQVTGSPLQYLMQIRRAEVPWEAVKLEADRLLADIKSAKSVLPKKPDYAACNELLLSISKRAYTNIT